LQTTSAPLDRWQAARDKIIMAMLRAPATVFVVAAIWSYAVLGTWAGDYPTRPIRLIVPAAPGGLSDFLARLLSEYLDHALGQPVVVENRPAAGGNLGVEIVAKAPSDGYSLGLIQVGNVAINPYLYKDLAFDPLRDLEPVASVANSPQIVTAYPGVPANNLSELIALAKQEPGKLSYGSAGVGTSTHIGAVLLEQMSGIKLLHVLYRGMGPALIDLTAGRVQLAFIGLGAIKSNLEAGTLKALALAQPTRLAAAPTIPTADESGLPGYEFNTWFGVVTTTGTPAAVVQKLNAAINELLEKPETKQRFSDLGMEPLAATSAAFAARIQKDYEKYGAMIKAAHVELN
jgi:tripartite-type tricarboxylate transporter receptor subunit TctC